MKFTLEIECDNAAFDGGRKHEVARILKELAKRIGEVKPDTRLRDINGNTVGFARFEQ